MRCLLWANAIRPYTLVAGFVLALAFTFSCSGGGGSSGGGGDDDSSSSVGGVVGVSSSSSGGKNRSSSSGGDITVSSSSSDNAVSSSSSHTPTWGEWQVTTPATCEAEGVETRTNDLSQTETRPIAKLAWSESVTPATCESAGVKTRTCPNNASLAQTETIAKLPYDNTTQFCYNNSKVVNLCGNRTEHYNPDLYECKPSINVNGIYLKNKPKDAAGKEYEAVLIGSQTWMAENLKYNASGRKCGDESTSTLSDNNTSTCDTYGRLYNWETAVALPGCNATECASQITAKHKGVCPSGWHLPSDAEWDALIDFVGENAGTKLKFASLWTTDGVAGTDDFGFAALPGGYGDSGSFSDVGYYGSWWSSTEGDASNAYYWDMNYAIVGLLRNNYSKDYLFSVRCVQD